MWNVILHQCPTFNKSKSPNGITLGHVFILVSRICITKHDLLYVFIMISGPIFICLCNKGFLNHQWHHDCSVRIEPAIVSLQDQTLISENSLYIGKEKLGHIHHQYFLCDCLLYVRNSQKLLLVPSHCFIAQRLHHKAHHQYEFHSSWR